MKELIEQISALGDSFLKDANAQLEKGNKAAGLRARRASLDLEPLLKRFRKLSPKPLPTNSPHNSVPAQNSVSERNYSYILL